MLNVGLDFGNGYVKAVWKDGSISFASAIGEWVSATNGARVKTLGDNTYRISTDGYQKIVGNMASRQSRVPLTNMSDVRWTQWETLHPLMLTALGLIAKKTGEHDFNLVTGLPIEHYETFASDAAKRLRGEFQFTLDGAKMLITTTVAKVGIGVIRCSFGQWAQAIQLSPDGTGDLSLNRIGLVDIGTGTTDLCVIEMNDGTPTYEHPLSESFPVGWTFVTSKVNDHLKAHGALSDHWSIDDAIRRGGKFGQIDIEGVTDKAVSELALSIVQMISAKWGNAALIDKIFLCGGPAQTLEPEIRRQSTISHFEMMKDPIFATARGYLRWAEFYGK